MNKLIKKLHKDVINTFFKLILSKSARSALAKITKDGDITCLDDDEVGLLQNAADVDVGDCTFEMAVHALSYLAPNCSIASQQMDTYKEIVYVLFDKNKDIINGRCLKHNLDQDAIEDFSQDFYIKLLRCLPSFDGTKAGFRTWMSYMVNNSLIDRHRAGNHFVVDGDINFESITGDSGVDIFSLDDIAKFCDKAMHTLESSERTVIEGRFGFGESDVMTYEQLSDITGIKPANIRRTTAPAAIKKLKKLINSDMFGFFSC